MPFVLSHPPDTAERVEGEPFYQLCAYSIQDSDAVRSPWHDFRFCLRAFKVLPPCDAVGLLSGHDATGLVVWSGALALLEWLLHHPDRLDAAMRSSSTQDQTSAASVGAASATHVIELGCGSGITTVGLHALLSRRRGAAPLGQNDAAARTHLWATDGNPDCVELAQRNVREQCSGGGDGSPSCGVAASAELLAWGDDAAAEQLLRKCCGDASPSCGPSVTIVSADVLYDAAAVPLLVSTAAKVADLRAPAGASGCCEKELEWWLAYAPRSLTRAGNECIFQTLLDAFAERGWTYEVFPLPAGAVTTGFEEHCDCDTTALRGCILVVRVKGAAFSSRE
ncbi:putative methyltransferase [Leptomonas pyrrhocoris]|uniref:Putative methyltransferase n=1 Tax=Leptomonas pyrrhocoris TaxID=157538 RepID=A0A0N0VDL0_LEPPY|nr:putative methyltransferase [Leptomonas pyrrhocoris]KPA75651.1 putative methyltransferase [Leptomonas pyrrhocoris]|eukprot:XP_015654090.1 putative methyltransferase [Leptomonas pyrrhocoris]